MRIPNKTHLWVTLFLSFTCCEKDPVWYRQQQPDISGDWMISVPEISGPDRYPDEGKCDGVEFEISLPRKGINNTPSGIEISGFHTGFSLDCSGITGSLEFQLGEDTVLVVPPAVLDGRMAYGHGCDENDPWPCEIPIWWHLEIHGAEFSLYSDSIVSPDGPASLRGAFEWPRTSWGTGYLGILVGGFTAHRRG